MKIKNILSFIVALIISTLAFDAKAQLVQTNLPVDLSMLTNHAGLVGWAFKQVRGATASVWCGSQTDGSDNAHFYQFTNSVKSLDSVRSAVLADSWYVQVTSVADQFNLRIVLFNTNDYNSIYGKGNAQVLFEGWNSGSPQQNPYEQWELPSRVTAVGLNLAKSIYIPCPNIADVRLITRDAYGNPSSMQLSSDGNGFYFPSDYAGNGELVLSRWLWNPTYGYWSYDRHAYSMINGAEIPLTWVHAQIIASGSPDVAPFKNTATISHFIWDWQDYYGNYYGVLPLVQVVLDNPTTNVTLSVTTGSGHYATSFRVEKQPAGTWTTNCVVPSGASSVSLGTNILQGTYYIYPQGLNLRPWPYGGVGVAVGKGG